MVAFIGEICFVVAFFPTVARCVFQGQCYSCNGVDSISSCNTIERCSTHQVCFLEEFRTPTGNMLYYGGCAELADCRATVRFNHSSGEVGLPVHNGIRSCAGCCRLRDFCNAHLCHKSVDKPVDHTTQGPLQNANVKCFSCDGVHTLQECSVVESCNAGHHCYLEVYAGTDGLLRYYGGCISDLACARTDLPTHVGEKICGVCCNHYLCNNNACGHQIKIYENGLLTGPKNRRCLQCYDQSLEEVGSCLNSVECASNTSRCSSVTRMENDLVTVDVDCEENLPCSSINAPPGQMCAECCRTDNCNLQLDCSQNTHSILSTTTTTAVPSITHRGVECEVCAGDSCGLAIGQAVTVHCPDNIAPFCVNEITNDVNGDKHVRKRCGSVSECEAIWLDNSSKNNNCSSFDPSSIYSSSFQCKFCCVSPNCNRNIVPDLGAQYLEANINGT